MENNRITKLFRLEGKVAVVTGASKGIGEAMCRGLAEAGAKVVISSRNQESVDAVAESFKKDGLEAMGIECHVAKEDHQKELIAKTVEAYGRVDILINNAGTNPYYGPVEHMDAVAYQKTLDINMTSALSLSNLCFPHMKAQGGGSIIHISSIEGIHPSPNFAAYNISKAGLIMLGKNQAVEWGRHNIRVNIICPGFVKTKLSSALWQNEELHSNLIKATPLQRLASPDEMAGLALFLASDARSFCTGSVILNDGGILHGGTFI